MRTNFQHLPNDRFVVEFSRRWINRMYLKIALTWVGLWTLRIAIVLIFGPISGTLFSIILFILTNMCFAFVIFLAIMQRRSVKLDRKIVEKAVTTAPQ